MSGTEELMILMALAVASNRVVLQTEELMPPQEQPTSIVAQPKAHTWIQTIGIILLGVLALWGKVSPTLQESKPTDTTTTLLDVIKTMSQANASTSVIPMDTNKQIASDVTNAGLQAQAAVIAAIAKGETNRTVLAPLAATTFCASLKVPVPVR